jgi:hypothetical protein
MRIIISLRNPKTFWIYERISSLSFWMYTQSVTLGKWNYTWLSQEYLSPVLLRFKFILQSWKGINSQVSIRFQQNWLKQEVKHYDQRSINSLILSGVRKNCLSSKRGPLLYQFTWRAIKLNVVIIKEYQLHTKFCPISFSQS